MDWTRGLTAIRNVAQVVGGLVAVCVLLVLWLVLMLVGALLIPADPFWRFFLTALIGTPWIPYVVGLIVWEQWQSRLRKARDEPVLHYHFPKSAVRTTRKERLRLIASNAAFVGACMVVAGVFLFGLRSDLSSEQEMGILVGALVGIPLGFWLGLWCAYRQERERVRHDAWTQWHAGGKELYERGQHARDG